MFRAKKLLLQTRTIETYRPLPLGLVVAFLVLCLMGLSLATESLGANSVTRNGVTWTFAGDYVTGKFANGDPYVVAPSGLKIISITPQWDGVKNGTMLNPQPNGRNHGFDTRVGNVVFDANLNIADNLPFNIPTNSSVVSAVGRETKSSSKRTWIDTVEVLTILASTPPPNSFRPPYAGTDKSIRGQVDDVDWSWIRNLKHPGNVREPSASLGNVQIDIMSQWQNSDLKTENTEHTYGRGIAYEAATSVLWLHLSNTKEAKTPTLIRLVQRGIDTFGILKSTDFGYWPNGGHNLGRKLPLLIAAQALGDAEIMSYSTSTIGGSDQRRWQEDGQHFFVTPSQIGIQPPQKDRPPYEQSHLGMPDWTSNAVTELDGATPAWSGWDKSGYRLVNGAPNVGQALAAELSGLRDEWDCEAFFRYIEERYWPLEKNNQAYANNKIYPFHAQMWNLYKEGDYTETTPPASNRQDMPTIQHTEGAFLGRQTIEIIAPNDSAGIYYTLDGSTPSTSSLKYTGPFELLVSATIKAIAATNEQDASPIASASLSIDTFTATEDWTNVELTTLGQTSELTFIATPSSNNVDAVFGFTDQITSSYSSMACIIRFNTEGSIDARDGNSYRAIDHVIYQAGTAYTFMLKIDTEKQTYSVHVKDQADTMHKIAEDFAFRTEAAGTRSITYFATRSLYDEPATISDIATIDFETAILNIRVPSISMLPSSGVYQSTSLEVSISSDQESAVIYYTLDGSEPSPYAGSTQMLGNGETLTLYSSTQLRAVAINDRGISSQPSSSEYTINEYLSTSAWTSIPIAGGGETRSLSVSVTPSASGVDCVLGLSAIEAENYKDLACIIRFNTSGRIDARDGSTYRAISEITYNANKTYQIKVLVDLVQKTYYATVTTPEGEVFPIAQGFAFRTEQIDTSVIGYFNTLTIEPGVVTVNGVRNDESLRSPAPANLTLSYNDS